MATKFRFKNADGTTVDFEDYYVRADYFRSGNLWSWGYNFSGQLGDNTITTKSSPVQTIAWGSNWKQISCGNSYTATIKADGTIWNWGDNGISQLGDNTSTHRSSPVQTIAFGVNWKSVSCGSYHTAAIKTDGTMWMWGLNGSGQLGDNTTTNRASPVQTIALGTNWKSVACGQVHTAAIKTDGTLWVFGTNTNGELGDNTIAHKSSPVQTIAGGTNWKQVYGGMFHTVAIKTDGTIWCWGQNSYGNLGDNTTIGRSSPVQTIAGGTNWIQIYCDVGYHTAAIKNDGTLWTWGRGDLGQLGGNTTTNISSPVQTVTYGTNWKQVSAGYKHTAAIKTDGTLWTWGNNIRGQLGDNTITNRSSPVQTIMYGTNWKQVFCGYGHTAAIQYQDDYQ